MSDKKENGGCLSKGKRQFFGLGMLVLLLVLSCAVPEANNGPVGTVEGDASVLCVGMGMFMIFMFVIVYFGGRAGGGGDG